MGRRPIYSPRKFHVWTFCLYPVPRPDDKHRDSNSTHLRSALSRVRGTVHDAFSLTARGGSCCDYDRCHWAATFKMAAAALFQLAAAPFACCWLWQCTYAPSHCLRLHCMIPRHDLGSSPRHAACPAGLLHPLHGLSHLTGGTHHSAISSAAPLHMHATCCRIVPSSCVISLR